MKQPKWKRCKVCGRQKRLAHILGHTCYVHINRIQSQLCQKRAERLAREQEDV